MTTLVLLLLLCPVEFRPALAQDGVPRAESMGSGSGGDVRGRKDAYSLAQNSALNVVKPGVLSNDLGLEGQVLVALLDSNVSHGDLVLNRDGSFSYSPQAGYVGMDGFTYLAKSGDTVSAVVGVTLEVIKAEVATENPDGHPRLDLAIYALADGYPLEPGAGESGGPKAKGGGDKRAVSLSHAQGESRAAGFLVELYNRDATAQSFVFKAAAKSRGWHLRYFDAVRQGNDITAQITSDSGWTSGGLTPNNSLYLRLEAALDPSVAGAPKGGAWISAGPLLEETLVEKVQATFGFQRLSKLQYSLDQGSHWLDAPLAGSGRAIVAPTQTIIGFRAVRSDPSLPWPFEPDIKPFWNDLHFGEAVWLPCEEPSEAMKPIKAECGNVLIANLKVVESFRVSLRPSKTYVPLGGGAEGQVSLRAKVTNSKGQPVVGATVRFTAKFEDGSMAGEMFGPGAQKDRAITDASGVATVTLTTGTVSATVSVKAILMESNRDTAEVQEQEVIFGLPITEDAEPIDI